MPRDDREPPPRGPLGERREREVDERRTCARLGEGAGERVADRVAAGRRGGVGERERRVDVEPRAAERDEELALGGGGIARATERVVRAGGRSRGAPVEGHDGEPGRRTQELAVDVEGEGARNQKDTLRRRINKLKKRSRRLARAA